MRLTFRLAILYMVTLLAGCGAWCEGWQKSASASSDGFCARYLNATYQTEQNNKAAYVNSMQTKCDGYGFQRGTPAYSQCLMNMDAQNNQAAYQQSIQQQQQLKNAAELLRGDGRAPGTSNCYRTPGGAGGLYCQ